MRKSHVEFTQAGRVIGFAVCVLLAFGLATIYVTNTHYTSGNDGPSNAVKQVVRIILSLGVGLVILRIGYQDFGRYSYFLFLGALILLIPLFVARALKMDFGGLFTPRNGAYRWIHLPGFLLQPSELMKVAFVLALAWYLRYRRNYRRLSGLLVPMGVAAVPLGLILLEPDLGTCVLLGIVLLIMLFMAGAKIRHFILISLIGLAALPIAWTQIKDYQRLRITAVLLQSDAIRERVIADPEKYGLLASRQEAIEWKASSGYQLVHSKNAVGSGGVFGYGWGNGMYATDPLLPDRHNDFVFAIIGHQWGLVGCSIILFCYVVIALCGVLIASSTVEPFARLLAVGITSLIVVQVLVNVAMTIGLMPITGMTLPFVSYGGSSLISNFICIALLISVSRHRPFLLAEKPFEFGGRRRKALHLAEPGEKVPASIGQSVSR